MKKDVFDTVPRYFFFHLKIKSKFSVLKASQLYHVKDEVRMYKPVDITHSSPHTTPLPPAQKKIN